MITTTSTLQLLLLALAGTAAGQDLDVQAQCQPCFDVLEGNNQGEYTHVIDKESKDCACVYQKIGTLDEYFCITDGNDTCADECPCVAQMDLLIVLDASGSMEPHWSSIITFVDNLVVAFAGGRSVGTNGIQMGLMTFHNGPTSQLTFSATTSLTVMTTAISGLPLPLPTHLTDMAAALRFAQTNMLLTSEGMRGPSIPKTIIFITDGVSTSVPTTATGTAAAALKTYLAGLGAVSADIFAIGVGPGLYDRAQLEEIATNNIDTNLPNVYTAEYNNVDAHIGPLVKAACEGAEKQSQQYQQLLVQKQKPGF